MEITKTAVTTSVSPESSTVYDIQKYDGNARTFKRTPDAYTQFVGYVDSFVMAVCNDIALEHSRAPKIVLAEEGGDAEVALAI